MLCVAVNGSVLITVVFSIKSFAGGTATCTFNVNVAGTVPTAMKYVALSGTD